MTASTDTRNEETNKKIDSIDRSDPLAALLRRTLLRSATLRSHVVGYAIEHTLSVDRFDARRERVEAGRMATDLLDCFVRLAESIDRAPVGNHYSRSGDVLWLSKKVPVSISTLRETEAEAVDAFLARVPDAKRMKSDAETVDLLRECCLTHHFLSYAVTSAVFNDVTLFRDGFHFVASATSREVPEETAEATRTSLRLSETGLLGRDRRQKSMGEKVVGLTATRVVGSPL